MGSKHQYENPPKHWYELQIHQVECSEDRINVISISGLSMILSHQKVQISTVTVEAQQKNIAEYNQ